MSEQKLSRAVLETSLQRADGLAKDADKVYHLARNLVFAVGLTASVFLILASSDSPQPDSTPPNITLRPNIQVPPMEPVVHLVPSDDWPTVNVEVVTSAILGAPAMNRDWHRTTFKQTGDQFWALPDGNFTLVFTPTGAFNGCAGDNCTGRFVVRDRAGAKLFDMLADANRTLVPSNRAANVVCNQVQPPLVLTQKLVCQLPTAPQASCVEMRRSEHPPVVNTGGLPTALERGTLALDIRWRPMRGGNCQGD